MSRSGPGGGDDLELHGQATTRNSGTVALAATFAGDRTTRHRMQTLQRIGHSAGQVEATFGAVPQRALDLEECTHVGRENPGMGLRLFLALGVVELHPHREFLNGRKLLGQQGCSQVRTLAQVALTLVRLGNDGGGPAEKGANPTTARLRAVPRYFCFQAPPSL